MKLPTTLLAAAALGTSLVFAAGAFPAAPDATLVGPDAGLTRVQGRPTIDPFTGPNCPRGGTRSARVTNRTRISFRNQNTGGEINVFWINFDGNWERYATLRQGQSYSSNSFEGHFWVVLDEQGRCLGAPTAIGFESSFVF
jgi:hypothetical protein